MPQNPTALPIYLIRNVTDPKQKEMDISHYVGKTLAKNVLPFSTKDNLREYLAEYDPKKRTKVHRDIESTLTQTPELFSTYNAGVTICAIKAEGIKADSNTLMLWGSSIINGAQTRGVIAHVCAELERQRAQFIEAGEEIDEEDFELDTYVTVELFVISDSDVSANAAVSRNNQNAVKMLSIVNKRGSLKGLIKLFGKKNIRTRESDPSGNGMVDTEKLVQILTALTPPDLWTRKRDKDGVPCKNTAYTNKQKCLLEFEEIYLASRDPRHPDHDAAKQVYCFYLDFAKDAWELYMKWKKHNGFKVRRVKCIKKNENREVEYVPEAFVFPIFTALAHLCRKENGKWVLPTHPEQEKMEADLIDGLYWFYFNNARSQAHQCGRLQTSYSNMDRCVRRWLA